MTRTGSEDGASVGLVANNNIVPLLTRKTVQLDFRNITCSINTFSMSKLRFGE